MRKSWSQGRFSDNCWTKVTRSNSVSLHFPQNQISNTQLIDINLLEPLWPNNLWLLKHNCTFKEEEIIWPLFLHWIHDIAFDDWIIPRVPYFHCTQLTRHNVCKVLVKCVPSSLLLAKLCHWMSVTKVYVLSIASQFLGALVSCHHQDLTICESTRHGFLKSPEAWFRQKYYDSLERLEGRLRRTISYTLQHNKEVTDSLMLSHKYLKKEWTLFK
jgi:hypothetical protein